MFLLKFLSLCIALLSFPILPIDPLSEIVEKNQHCYKMCSHKWDTDYSSFLATFDHPPLSTRRSISKLRLLYNITNNLLYFPSDIFTHKFPPSHASLHFDPHIFTIPFSPSSGSQINLSLPFSLCNSIPYLVKSSSSIITLKSEENMIIY